jgi:hypothetical protein
MRSVPAGRQAHRRPGLDGKATEFSPDAVAVAKKWPMQFKVVRWLLRERDALLVRDRCCLDVGVACVSLQTH